MDQYLVKDSNGHSVNPWRMKESEEREGDLSFVYAFLASLSLTLVRVTVRQASRDPGPCGLALD